MAEDQKTSQPGGTKKPKTEAQREKERARRRRRRLKKQGLEPGQDVPAFMDNKISGGDLQLPPDTGLVETKEEPAEVEEDQPVTEITEPELPARQAPSEESQEESMVEERQENEEEKAEEQAEIEAKSEQELLEAKPELEESQQIFVETPVYQQEEEEPTLIAEEGVEEDLETDKKHQAKQIMEELHGNESDHDSLDEIPQKQWIIGNLLKTVAGIVVALVLIVGAFWLGASLHLPDLVSSWFSAKPVTERLAKGDNSQVVVDTEMIQKWGFQTAQVFSKNLGDTRDFSHQVFYVAYYFGKLKDPIFYGETGITAAIYYGFGQDSQYFANKFIYYIKYLGGIRQANLVQVADVLSSQVHRDVVLDKFIADTQAIFDEGNKLRKEINLQVDDLRISLNSLTADHDRYQLDFFAALERIQPEKANRLIQNFIETSQKQVELKAKMAAMSRLAEDYNNDLLKMQARIIGMEKNRDALISGVTVTPVVGSDIDLVNQ